MQTRGPILFNRAFLCIKNHHFYLKKVLWLGVQGNAVTFKMLTKGCFVIHWLPTSVLLICSAGITNAQASFTSWYQSWIDAEPAKVRHFAANGVNWQFTQYKIHWRKFTKYTFQLNSNITLFPWQLRILFRWIWIEQFIRSWMIPSFVLFDYYKCLQFLKNKMYGKALEKIKSCSTHSEFFQRIGV